MLEQIARTYRLTTPTADVDNIEDDPQTTERVKGWLGIADGVATDFENTPARDRIEILLRRLEVGITTRDIAVELRIIREALEAGYKNQLMFRYPNLDAKMMMNWKPDWSASLSMFPDAERDIFAGVDLLALGHYTASVFHMMRVLEHGLRALAKAVGKSFDVQNWQNVIDQIEAEIRAQAKTLPAGSEKSERLRFLSNAAKEFVWFKDGWRNHVSHNRATYDRSGAENVMNHVRQFMTVLASQLRQV